MLSGFFLLHFVIYILWGKQTGSLHAAPKASRPTSCCHGLVGGLRVGGREAQAFVAPTLAATEKGAGDT